MTEDIDDKPMTVRHIREVLIPAMEEVFATKQDVRVLEDDLKQEMAELETRLREEMAEKFDKVLSGEDKILKDLETLLIEKTVSYHQWQKEQQLWAIVIDALKAHKILSSEQLQKIKELEVL